MHAAVPPRTCRIGCRQRVERGKTLWRKGPMSEAVCPREGSSPMRSRVDPAALRRVLVLLGLWLVAVAAWPRSRAVPPGPAAVPARRAVDTAAPAPLPPLIVRKPHGAVAPSPTGRRPKLLWSPEQQAVWNRMREQNHPWFQYLKANGDVSGTRDARYGDYGQWATLMYQVTGDEKYAEKAWYQITHGFNGGSFLGGKGVPTNNGNFTREYMMDFVWMYDWLRPWLTPEKRSLYIASLNNWADIVLAKKPASVDENGVEHIWTVRLSDSDQQTGDYFGVAFLDLATAEDNPRAGQFLREPIVGGLVSSSNEQETTIRNAIRYYCEKSEGGYWLESSEYNVGTLRLLVQGAEGIKMLTGRDYFPEVTALERQIAHALIHDLTPDLKQAFEWGDVQEIRTLYTMRRMTLAGMLAGILADDPESGPYIHQAFDEIAVKDKGQAKPWPPLFLFYNPYAPKADWRTVFPKAYYARGMGMMMFHNGWGEADSFFVAHMSPHLNVDHEVRHFGDFQLYRRGEWALTHPLQYGYDYSDCTNSILFGGLSTPEEDRGVVAQEAGSKDDYVYLAGTAKGRYYDPRWHPNQPPPFLKEWTRSLFYLPGKERSSETIIVHDRTNAEHPKKHADRYYEYDRGQIQASEGFKQWLLHIPSEPVLAADGFTWSTPGGQESRLTMLLPRNGRARPRNQKDVWLMQWPFPHPQERKWQITVEPDAERQWDTFLNVVQVGDSLGGARNVLVRSAGGEVEGALVQRSATEDALVLFGAQEASRFYQGKGFTVTWNSRSPFTDIFLLNIDPESAFAYSLDGRSALRIDPTEPAAVCRYRVAGPGEHTLKVIPRE